MELPQWFCKPNDLQTEQDIKEVLEYEQAQLEMIKEEFKGSTGEDGHRLYLDLVNAEMRVQQREGKVNEYKSGGSCTDN